jgi:nicotinamide-nucleotide amidase
VELQVNDQWLTHMEAFFRRVKRPMPESNKIQAMLPVGSTLIKNDYGTACGIEAVFTDDISGWLTDPEIRHISGVHETRIIALPGVPKEMKGMFNDEILYMLKNLAGGSAILSRTLHTFGTGESTIAEKLGDLMNRTRNPSIGTTVANGLVSLRINSRFPSKEKAQEELEQTTQACRSALGDLIFGQDDDTLPQVVAALLTSNKQQATSNSSTISTAESCTGGLLAKLLTDIPGSSSYFTQGWITYSNQAKYERLGVSMEVINLNGAVSEPVVEAMARNARRLSKSTFALSISGIAGPGGGSPSKPVGTVCIALAHPDPADKNASQVQSRTFHFPGDREAVRDRAAKMALTMLRYHLLGKPMP